MKHHKNCKCSPLSVFIEESQLMLRHLTPAIPPREILCSPLQAAWLCIVVTMADDCLHGNLNGPYLSLSHCLETQVAWGNLNKGYLNTHQQVYNRYDLQYISNIISNILSISALTNRNASHLDVPISP